MYDDLMFCVQILTILKAYQMLPTWRVLVTAVFVLLHQMFFVPMAQSQVSQSGTAAPAIASAVEAGPNAMTQALVQRGVLSCAARVEQVSRFLGFGPQAGAHLMPPAAPADQRLFSVQMELPAGAGGNSFVDMSFAPQQANGCGATYQTVSFWPQSCETVGNEQFAGFKPSQPLQRDVTVLNVSPATKVFLMRAGSAGCISMKKEIVL
jgi:hypothetical protein